MRRYGTEIGLSGSFTLLDEEDRRVLLNRVLRDLRLSDKQFPVRRVASLISARKNAVIDELAGDGEFRSWGILDGGLAADPAPVVTAPKVADVAAADKVARRLPDIDFTATLAGAVHEVVISGVISV